jgi:hypothetical protein
VSTPTVSSQPTASFAAARSRSGRSGLGTPRHRSEVAARAPDRG